VVRRPALKAVAGVLYGSIVFEPTWQRDSLGFVTCTFDAEVACTAGLEGRDLVQEIHTRTRRGGVRGLHLRTDGGDGRLVRCTHGAVVDVAVDLRPSSPTYRLWMTLVLDDVDHRSVWLPAGLAHGYQALSATADVCCRVNRIQRPEYETAIRYDDPELAIPWPLPVMLIDGRDESAPALAVVEPMLSDWFGAVR
jgi:dTDP-4-dehydrorhamnose 3,5-epimerase